MSTRRFWLAMRSWPLVLVPLALAPAVSQADISFDTGIVAGTVEVDNDGVVGPLAQADVRLEALDGSGALSTRTDESGHYSLEAPEGEYRLQVYSRQPHAQIQTDRTVMLVNGAPLTEDFVQIRGRLDGTFVRNNGTPFPDASVTAMLDGGGGLNIDVASNGSFSVFVPEGAYTITGRYAYKAVDTDAFVATKGSTANVSLRYASSKATIQVIANGAPIEGATVDFVETGAPSACLPEPQCEYSDGTFCERCYDATSSRYFWCDFGTCTWEDGFSRSFETGPDGKAVFYLPPGPFDITTTSPWTGNNRVQLRDPLAYNSVDLGTLTMPIAYQTGTILGSVTANGTDPLQNAAIQLVPLDQPGYGYDNSDAGGGFAFDVPVGNYDLYAGFDDQWLGPVPVTVVAGSNPVMFDFTVGADPLGTLVGAVDRDGTPASGVEIWAREGGAPTVCGLEEDCGWREPDGTFCEDCYDVDEDRFFHCWDGGCEWVDARYAHTQTTPDGQWSLELEPGTYDVGLRDYANDHVEHRSYSYFPTLATGLVVADGTTTDLGTHAFDIGTWAGHISSCTEDEPNGNVNLNSADAHAYARTADDGTFAAIAPHGSYSAWIGYPFESLATPIAVDIPGTPPLSLDFVNGHGTINGFVYKNSEPAVGIDVRLREPTPSSCAADGATCNYDDGWFCECELDGRGFYCETWEPGVYQCEWFGASNGYATTGTDGRFAARVRPGEYLVTAYFDEGGGSIEVGSLFARAFLCDTTEIGTSGAPVSPGSDVVVDLGEGVSVVFDSVISGGTLSFVATSEVQGGVEPPGLIEFLGLFYDLSSDADWQGPGLTAEVCLPFSAPTTCADAPTLLHYDDQLVPPDWIDITTSCSDVDMEVCGLTEHFSWFVVAVLETAVDGDEDGVEDELDNCPEDRNADQADYDGDGDGDACDIDGDGDAVDNDLDDCAESPLGIEVGPHGCTSAQRLERACPAHGSYRNHGAYVSCVSQETQEQLELGLIDESTRDVLVSAAAHSPVGKKP